MGTSGSHWCPSSGSSSTSGKKHPILATSARSHAPAPTDPRAQPRTGSTCPGGGADGSREPRKKSKPGSGSPRRPPCHRESDRSWGPFSVAPAPGQGLSRRRSSLPLGEQPRGPQGSGVEPQPLPARGLGLSPPDRRQICCRAAPAIPLGRSADQRPHLLATTAQIPASHPFHGQNQSSLSVTHTAVTRHSRRPA